VFDDDQGLSGLFKNGHELKDCEGPADLGEPYHLGLPGC
jgi:hypothetical protein